VRRIYSLYKVKSLIQNQEGNTKPLRFSFCNRVCAILFPGILVLDLSRTHLVVGKEFAPNLLTHGIVSVFKSLGSIPGDGAPPVVAHYCRFNTL
jgi:hypothetical protein